MIQSTTHTRRDLARRQGVRLRLSLTLDEVYADAGGIVEHGGRPLIVIANHVCSLDGAIAMLLCDSWGRDIRLAMASALFDRHPWLSRLGAFPVARGNPIASARLLRDEGARLRANPSSLVWVFPQGGHVREVDDVLCENGVLVVAAAAPGAEVLPVALHYDMFERAKPTVWVKVGAPLRDTARRRGPLDHALREVQGALLEDLRNATGSYRPMLRRRRRDTLIANVPCDCRRFDAAAHAAGCPEAARQAAAQRLDELAPEDAVAFLAAIKQHDGPVYGRLLEQAMNPTRR